MRDHQTSRSAGKARCFLAPVWKLCCGIQESTTLQPSKTSVSREENATASALNPVLFLYFGSCFQCKKHKQSLGITLVFAVTFGKPAYVYRGFESVLQVAWGCGFPLFLVLMRTGDCIIPPFTGAGRTVLSRVIDFSKVWGCL